MVYGGAGWSWLGVQNDDRFACRARPDGPSVDEALAVATVVQFTAGTRVVATPAGTPPPTHSPVAAGAVTRGLVTLARGCVMPPFSGYTYAREKGDDPAE